MTQPMKGYDGQLTLRRLVSIISVKHILQGLIRRGVVHHLAVVLYENPIPALPKVTEVGFELFSGLLKGHDPERQFVWNGHSPCGHLRFGLFTDLSALDDRGGFRDADGVRIEVDIGKFKGEDFALAEAGVDGQIEQDANLLRYLLVNLVGPDHIGNPGIIHSLVAGHFEQIRRFDIGSI